MDEILIDDKKYVSSKRAAKMTGYAKDYIGQLCREGRVPARLVGRSWYVLETAIQDHRFGASDTPSEEGVSAEKPASALPWTRESPRYEPAPFEVLPTMNRLKEEEIESAREEDTEIQATANLQNSWKAWFDHIGRTIEPVTPTPPPVTASEPELEPEIERETEPGPEESVVEAREDEEVNIPIHTIYRMPPKELLPRYAPSEPIEATNAEEKPIRSKREGSRGVVRVIRVTLVVLAILAASVAVIGSGYLDNFVISNSQVSKISGIEVYNK